MDGSAVANDPRASHPTSAGADTPDVAPAPALVTPTSTADPRSTEIAAEESIVQNSEETGSTSKISAPMPTPTPQPTPSPLPTPAPKIASTDNDSPADASDAAANNTEVVATETPTPVPESTSPKNEQATEHQQQDQPRETNQRESQHQADPPSTEAAESRDLSTGQKAASISPGRRTTSAMNDDGPGSKIFIGGLSWETNEEGLRNYFSRFGELYDVVIMRDRHTGHPRGFGFVTFADDNVASLVASSRHDIDGRQVEAKRAVPRSETPPGGTGERRGGGGGGGGGEPRGLLASYGGGSGGGSHAGGQSGYGMGQGQQPHPSTLRKIFVGGLPSACGNQEFADHFRKFGEIVDAQVMFDRETGNSRGFGFVTFGSESSVVAAVAAHRHEVMGKMVEVKRAEPKQGGGGGGGGGGGSRSHGQQQGRDPYGRGSAGPGAQPAASGQMGTQANAAAAYSGYGYSPQQLMEQYGAYYSNPQWQQYYASLGYNYGQQYSQNTAQGFNPYQYYAAHYAAQNAAAQSGGQGAASGVPGGTAGVQPGAGGPLMPGGQGGMMGGQGGDMSQGGQNAAGPERYGRGTGDDESGGGRRGGSRSSDRYHPYR